MVRWLCVAVLLMSGCRTIRSQDEKPIKPVEELTATFEIRRIRSTEFSLRYTFSRPIHGFRFFQDHNLYRAKTWTPLDSGVKWVVSEDKVEILLSNTPRDKFEFKVQAFTGPVAASFDPYLQFSRNGIAVEIGQFHVDPVQSTDYLGVKKGAYSPIRVQFKSKVTGDMGSRRTVIVEGQTRNLPLDVSRAFGSGHNVYVYFGSGQIENIHASTALVDRALPKWLQRKVRDDIGSAIDFYSRNLGPRPPLRINFLVTWEPEADLSVIPQSTVGGSVMDGGDVRTIDLVVYKKRLDKSDAELLRHFQMVIFHELAHFWNRTESQNFRPVGWMIEGGADAITYRALRDLKRITIKEYQNVVATKTTHCRESYRAPIVLADLQPNDDYYLAYACGFFVSVFSEDRLVDKNYFAFLRELFARRDRQNGKYTIDDYFSILRERSLKTQELADLRRWIESPGPADRETIFK